MRFGGGGVAAMVDARGVGWVNVKVMSEVNSLEVGRFALLCTTEDRPRAALWTGRDANDKHDQVCGNAGAIVKQIERGIGNLWRLSREA